MELLPGGELVNRATGKELTRDEAAKFSFAYAAPMRGSKLPGEFSHFHAGGGVPSAGNHCEWRPMTIRQQAQKFAQARRSTMPPHWLRPEPRAPPGVFNKSHQSRSVTAVHLPENAGWHRKAQNLPCDSRGAQPDVKSLWKPAKPPTMISRGPKVMPMSTINLRGRDLEWNSNSAWSLPQ